jgi:hypothetical protein
MDTNTAVKYQNPTHLHAQSDVANLVANLAAKADKPTTGPVSSSVQVTGTISPDATGSYNQNGTYNGSPAFERVGGGWWFRYDYGVAGTYYWRLCQGISAMTATARWSSLVSTTYPAVVPDQGSYTPMSGATGTATVTLGQSADNYLASYDANGNLVLAVQKSDVVMKTDGVFTLAGEVQEGTGTVATGDNSHAEGLNSKCGYAADTCTISGTTVTITGNATTRFSFNDSVLFTNLSGVPGSTAPQQRTIVSSPMYMTTTTTFTINSVLNPAHTSGKVVSLNKGRYGHAEGICRQCSVGKLM